MTELELKIEDANSCLEQSKATRDLFSRDRVEFFNRIGPDIAHQMTNVLQKLTGENIKVEFGTIQIFEEGKVVIDTGDKCFGSSLNFRCPEAELDGVAVMFFPLSSTRILTESLLKHFLGQSDKEEVGPEIKLSAFKETLSILLSTYATGIANALNVKLETSVPKLVGFRNVEFAKSTLLDRPSNSESMISVG